MIVREGSYNEKRSDSTRQCRLNQSSTKYKHTHVINRTMEKILYLDGVTKIDFEELLILLYAL